MSELVWRMLFETFDRNGDGRVDRSELENMLSRLSGRQRMDVDDVLDGYDTDGSGDLNFLQFAELVQGKPPPVNVETLRAFRAFDLDGDGAISVSELTEVFAAAGVKATAEIEAFIAEGDANRDGKLTFSEFLAVSQEVIPSQ